MLVYLVPEVTQNLYEDLMIVLRGEISGRKKKSAAYSQITYGKLCSVTFVRFRYPITLLC